MKKGLFLILGLVSVLAIVTLGGCAGTASPKVTGFFNTQQEGVCCPRRRHPEVGY